MPAWVAATQAGSMVAPTNAREPASQGREVQKLAMLPEAQADLAALVDLPRHDLKLEIDFEALTYQGLASVSYTNTDDVALDRVYFRLLPNDHQS